MALPDRQNRKRAYKPPEQSVTRAPAHARPVAAHVTLKQDAEARADDEREDEMERHAHHHRSGAHQSSDQWKEIDLRHPFAERLAADDPGQSADHYRA